MRVRSSSAVGSLVNGVLAKANIGPTNTKANTHLDVTTAPDGYVRNVHIQPQVTTMSRAARIEAAKLAPVPQRVQVGPTCGLYALGMVMDHWHLRDANNATAWVQDLDNRGKGAQYTLMPTDARRLLDVAKEAGYTALGEMFTAKQLGAVAESFGYRAVTHEHATLAQLYAVLDAGHPAIVGFDVDNNGNPTDSGGARAHYAVIQGYFDDGGERYLVARHGWGVQRDHVWRASDFDKSWRALERTSFYGTPGDGVMPTHGGTSGTMPEPHALSLPPDAPGMANIRASLGTKIVEVMPTGETAAVLV
jgi:hypothetical protein